MIRMELAPNASRFGNAHQSPSLRLGLAVCILISLSSIVSSLNGNLEHAMHSAMHREELMVGTESFSVTAMVLLLLGIHTPTFDLVSVKFLGSSYAVL